MEAMLRTPVHRAGSLKIALIFLRLHTVKMELGGLTLTRLSDVNVSSVLNE